MRGVPGYLLHDFCPIRPYMVRVEWRSPGEKAWGDTHFPVLVVARAEVHLTGGGRRPPSRMDWLDGHVALCPEDQPGVARVEPLNLSAQKVANRAAHSASALRGVVMDDEIDVEWKYGAFAHWDHRGRFVGWSKNVNYFECMTVDWLRGLTKYGQYLAEHHPMTMVR